MEIKRPAYLKKLIEVKENGRVKVITGIKGCGKTYLLCNIYKNYLLNNEVSEDHIIEIHLDNDSFVEYRNPFKLKEYIMSKVVDNECHYVFIDEIQESITIDNPYIPNGEDKITFVDVLLSLMKKKNIDVYVTGSNSKMLTKDIPTQFRDRGDNIHVHPLSFREIVGLFDSKEEAWRFYSHFGGMPYMYTINNNEARITYLNNLFIEKYLKDIVTNYNIKNSTEILDTLLNFTASNIGSLTNATKLSKRFLLEMNIHISSETITNYLEYFEDAFLLYKALRYNIKGAKYFSSPCKFYYADIGLRNSRIDFKQTLEETHIMENIIYNDLIARGYSVDVGFIEDRVKEDNNARKQLEVNFIVNHVNARYYIQSAYSLPTEEKFNQVRRPFLKIRDSFRKIVIVFQDIIPRYDEYGIYYIGLFDFLCSDEPLKF